MTSPDCARSSPTLSLVLIVWVPVRASIMNISVPTFQTFLRKVSSPFQAGTPNCAIIDLRIASSVMPAMNCYVMLFRRRITLVLGL